LTSRILVNRKPVAAQHFGEGHRVLAPERGVGRHPLPGRQIALVLVGFSRHGQQIGRVVGETFEHRIRPIARSHVPGKSQRHDVVDLHRCANLVAAQKRNRLVGVRVAKGAAGDGLGAAFGADVGLVHQITLQDVVAGVTPVAPARRAGVVIPGVPERRPAVVVPANTLWHNADPGQHVGAGLHTRRRPGRRVLVAGARYCLDRDKNGHHRGGGQPQHGAALHALSR
jgi:hypothetical protein